MLTLFDLSVAAVKNPSFVPTDGLYLGWKLASDNQSVYQTAYTATITERQSGAVAWTGKGDRRSVHVPVDVTLKPRTAYTLTVSVEDNHGETAEASIPFATALTPSDWEGVWIKPCHHIESWAPYLRTKFETSGEIASATLYAAGLGCGEYYVNGHRVSEDLIDPPFANYEREVLYRAYDVTELVGEKNTLAALLGDGWYSQSRAWLPIGKYGDVCLKAQLEITYTDGRRQVIATNTESWTYKYSPITLNNLYGGETYDARIETPDFALYESDEEGWGRVVEDVTPRGALHLAMLPSVRSIRTLPARSVTRVSGKDDGAWIIDFGENVAGVAEIHIPPAPRGAKYTLRFAETLSEHGTLDFRSTGSFATQCIQEDVYVARGDKGGETYRPRFTYHGFRYMEVAGYHDLRKYGMDPELTFATAYALSTEMTEIGSFESASEDLDHFQRIAKNTIRSNFHGFPEDCPAREKCGWLGDVQVVCDTALLNYDLEAHLRQYLQSIRTTREVFGVWQMISPGHRTCGEASPLWGAAIVIIPYCLYRYYGSEETVRDFWDEMQAWITHELADAERGGDGYVISRGLGDWCPPIPKTDPRRIPVPESSTAILYELACIMDELSIALDLPRERDYRHLAEEVKKCFNEHFWNAETHAYSTCGTCGVALATGLYPDGEREALTESLISMIRADGHAMYTGIYGNKYLIPALTDAGYGDDAMKVLFGRDHLSFGTMMDDGATSIWERIDMSAVMPRDVSVSSYNHPMHASFAYFMYAHVAGIRPLTAGFETFEITPCRFTDIPSASVSHVSPYGEIRVEFERKGSATTYKLTVPVGTTAHFRTKTLQKTFGSGVYTLTVEE